MLESAQVCALASISALPDSPIEGALQSDASDALGSLTVEAAEDAEDTDETEEADDAEDADAAEWPSAMTAIVGAK